ncbi:MAG: dihydropteroate synthase [Anaerolineae bacterium]|jgi:5-methyltetrahydrofolate corrinoid/iron sulfur protein methyltransferase
MYIIGENIQILAPKIKAAIADRDASYVRELARAQVAHGANMLDLNIGPRKRDGIEVMQWMIEEVYDEVGAVPLSLDTTNAAAIKAGLEKCSDLGIQAMINSTSADPDRLNTTMPMAAEHGAKIIALSMDKNIPATADGRVALAMEILIPKAEELGMPMENVYLDPLVLTVNGCQEHGPETLNAIRSFKMLWDPSPMTTVGLSNISNSVPHEGRSLLNRTYLVMLMACGLDSAIADPLDEAQNEVIRLVEERDDSTGVGKALLALYDAVEAMDEFTPDHVDMSDPDQEAIYKTVRILENKVIYAHGYLTT